MKKISTSKKSPRTVRFTDKKFDKELDLLKDQLDIQTDTKAVKYVVMNYRKLIKQIQLLQL